MKKYFILLLFSAIYSQSPFQSPLPADIRRFGVEQIDSLINFIGGTNNNWQETDTAFIYNLNSNEYCMNSGERLFFKSFNYPFQNIKGIKSWLITLDDDIKRREINEKMKSWYLFYYTNFKNNLVLKTIKNHLY